MVAAAISSSFADECKQSGLPVVLLNRKTDSRSVSSAVGASRVGAETIAKFLHTGGHRRYAFIAGSKSSTSRDREDAFKRYLTKHDLKLHARVDGNYSFEQTRIVTRELLTMEHRPDAIFCVNDHTAISAINVAKVEFGLELGRELSIVGVDDSEMAGWPVFDLTSYGQPIGTMVEHVVETIRMQRDGKNEPIEVVAPSRGMDDTRLRFAPSGAWSILVLLLHGSDKDLMSKQVGPMMDAPFINACAPCIGNYWVAP